MPVTSYITCRKSGPAALDDNAGSQAVRSEGWRGCGVGSRGPYAKHHAVHKGRHGRGIGCGDRVRRAAAVSPCHRAVLHLRNGRRIGQSCSDRKAGDLV
jgi:hypothetical protein